MKSISDFFTGTLSSYGLFISVDHICFIDSGLINQLFSTIIAIIGGVISTIVLNILRSRYPKLFKPISSLKKKHTPD